MRNWINRHKSTIACVILASTIIFLLIFCEVLSTFDNVFVTIVTILSLVALSTVKKEEQWQPIEQY